MEPQYRRSINIVGHENSKAIARNSLGFDVYEQSKNQFESFSQTLKHRANENEMDWTHFLENRDDAYILEILKSPQDHPKDSKKLMQLLERGFPQSRRRKMWSLFTNAHQKMLQKKLSQKFYEDLTKTKHQILLDLQRTFPNHHEFRKQDSALREKLENVLTLYAAYNPKVGYCQGMNFICGLILLATAGNEEETFYTLQYLIENRLNDYFLPSLLGTLTDMRLFQDLVSSQLVEIDQQILDFGLCADLFSSRWFVSCFIELLSPEVVLIILDNLFCYGRDILQVVGLGFLKLNETEILSQNSAMELSTLLNRDRNPNIQFCDPSLLLELGRLTISNQIESGHVQQRREFFANEIKAKFHEKIGRDMIASLKLESQELLNLIASYQSVGKKIDIEFIKRAFDKQENIKIHDFLEIANANPSVLNYFTYKNDLQSLQNTSKTSNKNSQQTTENTPLIQKNRPKEESACSCCSCILV